jgi:putative nucleotidyltransferase with HDIG domain
MRPAVLVRDARELAEALLADVPERWRHSVGVAGQADYLVRAVPDAAEGDVLVAAAWLHDIGYTPTLRQTGFHPLDGALHLRDLGWPQRIAALVANHSEAWWVADFRGLADRLSEFPREYGAVSDALTYADQTVGPNGRHMGFEQRLEDMLRRHGPDSPNAAVHPLRAPLLRAAVHRVEQRLSAHRRGNVVNRPGYLSAGHRGIGVAPMGHPDGMTDPNDDLSSIADPGSMGPAEMTEPDNDLPGDLDVDHSDEARTGEHRHGTPAESQATEGAPLGPPD